MDSGEVFALIAAERRRAADMFDGFRDEQWAAQSLCAEWTVRDVAAHLIGPFRISVPRFLAGALLSGVRVGDRAGRAEAQAHGRQLGIPEPQLDRTVCGRARSQEERSMAGVLAKFHDRRDFPGK